MKNINWLNHLIEFVVVIIGILIAFQLSTCSEKRKQTVLVQEHLVNLEVETTFNQNNLQAALEHAELTSQKLDTLFRLIPQDEAVTAINQLSLDILNLGGVYLKKNAYRSLTESGDIRFIHDFQLKNEIVNLYEFYEWVAGIDKVTTEFYLKEYYPFVMEYLDLIQAQPQPIETYRAKRYKNILATYKYHIVQRIQKYKDCESEMIEFLDLLTEE